MFETLRTCRITPVLVIVFLCLLGTAIFKEALKPRDLTLFFQTAGSVLTIQEHAQKKLMPSRASLTRVAVTNSDLGIEPPDTMIAENRETEERNEIDAFPIVLAAPSN